MLMAEAFSSLLRTWDRGDLSDVPKTLITDEIVVSLYQVLVRTLMTQNANGSWGSSNSREVTAYATLTISKAATLPFTSPIKARIGSAIAAAQAFLLSTRETAPSYLWVEKVTYGSVVLAESYVLAALNASSRAQSSLSSGTTSVLTIPSTNVKQLSQTCFESPLFDSAGEWKLQAAYIEGCLFIPYLQRLASGSISNEPQDKAFEIIPFVWAACNYIGKQPLTTSGLREKMRDSLLEHLRGKSIKAAPIKAPVSNGISNATKSVNGSSVNGGHTPTTNGIHKEAIPAVNGSSTQDSLDHDIAKYAIQACTRALGTTSSNTSAVVHVPQELTYLLPEKFTGNVKDSFLRGTATPDNSIDTLLSLASKSIFTSYDDRFASVVGLKVSAKLVINRPGSSAFFEAGVYVPSLDEVWFTSSYAK